jgi:hypothetical protein
VAELPRRGHVAGGALSFARGSEQNVNLATGIVSKGLAQVLATTKSGILCSAYADASSLLPASMVRLTIAKKTKQKGD